MRKTIIFLLLSCIFSAVSAQKRWESKLVNTLPDGRLVYLIDPRGNIIPDFSGVGYNKGKTALPVVPVVTTISPDGKNDDQKIQNAINALEAQPIQKNGFRGAILLKKGTYKIPGTIKISKDGIVLRGEGNDTRLIASGKGQRKLITVSGTGKRLEVPGSRVKINQKYIPVGEKQLTMVSGSGFRAGDKVVVFRPGTAKWIKDLKMDQIEPGNGTIQWDPAEYGLEFERTITKVTDNYITMDDPTVMAMEDQYGGGEVYKYTFEGRINNVGIENLLCESEYTSATDEDHGWDAISFNRIEGGWVKNVTSRYFGYSCVNLGNFSKNITVVNCNFLEPKSKIEGGRRYSFNNDGQLNLVVNCYASEGRHDYVTGARVSGPNVFFNSRSENAKADIGPHHRWATGTLFDNITTDGEINIQDRGNWGTGHGWSGINQIVWGGSAAKAAIQDPWVSGKNYSIGLKTVSYDGRLKGRLNTVAEGQNREALTPGSLYLTQLNNAIAAKPIPNIFPVDAVLKKHILEEAKWAMQQQPVTVTAASSLRSAGGKHDFFSEGDYWWPDSTGADKPYVQRDGLTNPDNFTAHREAMIRFSRIVGALASAYKITGDEKYVAQAVLHCKAWFTDAATFMNPSLLYTQAIKGRFTGRGIGIIDTIQLMEVVQGLMAMRSSGFIPTKDWEGFQDWFDKYLVWLTTHQYGKDEMEAKNNHGTCWVMQVGVFAKFTGNLALMNLCVDRFKNKLIPEQMALDGSFPLELKRTKPYGYSIFNLDAMATICQTLSTPYDDLWDFAMADGRSVKKGVEYLYPYLKNKDLWKLPKDVMYWNNWPVAQPSLIFAAEKFGEKEWFQTWKAAEHAPTENEVIRNLPVRNPLIWLK